MIADLRIREPHPGRLRDVLALYEKVGRPVPRTPLGNSFSAAPPRSGTANESAHIRTDEDLVDRSKRCAAVVAVPAGKSYLHAIREYMCGTCTTRY